MFLDEVHQVLQMVFGWSDSHLHRFALGPSVWDETSELFLCPFDVAEGEDDGVPASGVRIDEVLADVGDELLYVYDYGDEWELRIRLESVVDRAPGAVRAVCTGGLRGAPPENCGGIYAYDDAVTAPGVEQADAFDAGTYVALTEAMNSHDVGPSPEGLGVQSDTPDMEGGGRGGRGRRLPPANRYPCILRCLDICLRIARGSSCAYRPHPGDSCEKASLATDG
jgi:Plasmid pRiA4b ORF-3-like protein